MADDPERRSKEQEAEDPADEEGPVETPFDHPLFLPVILVGLSLWFFYDGFINQDPDMLEHLTFNRGGFAILSVAAVWFGYKGWQEMRKDASSDTRSPVDNRPIG